MTVLTNAPESNASDAASDLVWPVAVPAEEAVRRVSRRLPGTPELAAQLYHHPFLGMTFLLDRRSGSRWGRAGGSSGTGALVAAVLVDLVSGRPFLTDPWDDADLTTRANAAADTPGHGVPDGPEPRGPRPRITDDQAIAAGRELLPGVLTRRRRLDALAAAELDRAPVRFGKPNWWITGRSDGRELQVVVDALNGRHYVVAG